MDVPWRLLLFIAFLSSFSSAAPKKPWSIRLYEGEPHEIQYTHYVKALEGLSIPSWMKVDETSKTVYMVPPPFSDSKNFIDIDGEVLEVAVHQDQDQYECEKREWIDVASLLSPVDSVHRAIQIAEMIGVEKEHVRIFPFEYAYKYRQLEDQGVKAAESVIIMNMKCDGELMSAAEYVETMMGEYEDTEPTIVHGTVVSRSQRKEDANSVLSSLDSSTGGPDGEELKMTDTSTRPSTTTTRVSRSTTVALVKLKSLTCQQGKHCQSEINEKTFISRMGNVNTFDLSIEPITDSEDSDERKKDYESVRPWVVKTATSAKINVIPLKAGEYQFRLMGTSHNKTLSSPFSITVKDDKNKPNHNYVLALHSPKKEDIMNHPKKLLDVFERFTGYLKLKIDDVTVVNMTEQKNEPIITWYNSSLSTERCDYKAIEGLVDRVVVKHSHKIKHDVVDKVGRSTQLVHLKSFDVDWMGSCSRKKEEKEIWMKNERTRKRDEDPSAEEANTSEGSLSILIVVVSILLLLVALLIFVLCCFACRKQSKKSEYMSKGTPVVFPEEVDEDGDDTPATAPMLVKEERPPLRISQHENPLYKPPPPLSVSSPRPTPAPLSSSTQRLPPPYVPP